MSEYDYLILTNSHNDGSTSLIYNSQIVFINRLKETSYNKAIECMWLNVNQMFYRILNITSSTQITCADTNGDSSKNAICVPQKIIGIQLVHSEGELPNYYSTEETVIGKWIDGKPIYRKVIELTNAITISHISFTNSTIPISTNNIDKVINVKGYNATYTSRNFSAATDINNYIQLMADANEAAGVKYLVLEYTKTTD